MFSFLFWKKLKKRKKISIRKKKWTVKVLIKKFWFFSKRNGKKVRDAIYWAETEMFKHFAWKGLETEVLALFIYRARNENCQYLRFQQVSKPFWTKCLKFSFFAQYIHISNFFYCLSSLVGIQPPNGSYLFWKSFALRCLPFNRFLPLRTAVGSLNGR